MEKDTGRKEYDVPTAIYYATLGKERKEDVYIQIRLHVYKRIYGSSDCSIHMVRQSHHPDFVQSKTPTIFLPRFLMICKMLS